jgi:hypothetical protein
MQSRKNIRKNRTLKKGGLPIPGPILFGIITAAASGAAIGLFRYFNPKPREGLYGDHTRRRL